MRELADEVYTGMSEAIEEVEKDLEYNPKQFLGITLYPDSILSIVTFVLTVVIALLQMKLDSM